MAGISKTDKYARLKTIQDWISAGKSNKALHRLIQEKFDLINYDHRRKLINEALREIYSDTKGIRKTNIERIDAIIERAMDTGKDRLALEAIDKQNKTAGVYTEKHEHSFQGGVIKIKFGE